MELFDLTGQVAVVTGSTRGIGLAIAEALARAGAGVVISSRKEESCQNVASRLSAEGLKVLPIPCHIGKKEDLERLVTECERDLGPIDCLVCNAAVNPHYGPLSEVTDQIFAKTIDSNVRSNLWLCNRVVPRMAERFGGSVILVSSIAALGGTHGLSMYAISKAALLQLARNLAVQWGPRNVRVNSIVPGLIRTEFSRKLWETPHLLKAAESTYPLRRIGEPADIGGAAVFLASRAGHWITGQTIIIDGGATVVGM
jgi:NAD(P)-dependent dehydrogenase (short-subunit alcohol dehydrogenase family)